VDAWLKLTLAQFINLYLVEQRTGILNRIRTMEFPAKFLKSLKEILAQQYLQYGSMEQVDAIGCEIFKNKTIKLIKQWKQRPAIPTPENSKTEISDDGWYEII
jgi:hypothetical protein